MKKISLRDVIAAGTWFECHAKCYDEDLHFRLRVVAFTRTSVEEIDPTQVNKVVVEGILWLLHIEVVNLGKTPTSACRLGRKIKVADQDGFEFHAVDTGSLPSAHPGLKRFADWSSTPLLSPKIKACGSIAFDLPDEETSYYLAIKDGSIKEA